MVLVEGDPHPGAFKGRMSFQSFNPSIDVSIYFQCPKVYLWTIALCVLHGFRLTSKLCHYRDSMKK